MVISCTQCNCRFRVDDAKVPAGSFTVNCPKCQKPVTASGAQPVDRSALAGGKSPSTSQQRHGMPAPLFKLSSSAVPEGSSSPASDVGQLANALINLYKSEKSSQTNGTRPSWDHRRALICVAQKHRDKIGRGLTENGYEAFVAEDTQQAVERMRESRVDIVILDQDFDPAEQGAAFVLREVNILRPAERRRLFFVCLSSSKRSMDAHAAFLQSVNLMVNVSDLDEFPSILDRTLRDFNELYREFNVALNVHPL